MLDSPPWPSKTSPAVDFCDEHNRLRVLASFDLGGVEGDPELAQLARFAAKLCGAPSAAVSLVEEERQRFIASEGLDTSETPRATSFCAHAMLGDDLLEVLDASSDPRFAEFELVRGEAHVRYYVGAPLISSEGAPMGALCVTDTAAHSEGLSKFQREGLEVLAQSVKRRLEAHRQAHLATFELQESAARVQFTLDSMPDIAWSAAPGPEFDFFNARYAEVTGHAPPTSVDDWRKVIHPEDFEASLVKLEQAMSQAALFEDEWRLLQADGSYRWIVSRAVPSSDDPATARWFGTLTDIHDRYSISQERELLAGELAHRIKNIFSVITGLVSLKARQSEQTRAFGEDLSKNIRALARAHDYALPLDGSNSEELLDLLDVLMQPYQSRTADSITITGEKVHFGQRAATPLALVFHELGTNSAKYGALSAAQGNVAITVTPSDDTVAINWRESGGPATEEPSDTGFGSRLMRMTIEHQLAGKLDQTWHAAGLEVTITIPREQLEH